MELRPNSTAQFLFVHCTHCIFCKLTKTSNISRTNPFLIDNTFHSPTHAKQNRFFADPIFFFFFSKLHKNTLSSTLRSRWTLRWRPPGGSPPLILARKDVVSALYFFLQMNYVFQSQLSLTHTHTRRRAHPDNASLETVPAESHSATEPNTQTRGNVHRWTDRVESKKQGTLTVILTRRWTGFIFIHSVHCGLR